MVIPWNLKDSKFPLVSRTLLRILSDFNNALVWMVATCPFISMSSRPFISPSVTVPSASISFGIIIIFTFQVFTVLLQVLGIYLSFHFLSVLRCDLLKRHVHYSAGPYFWLTISSSGHLAEVWWSVLFQNPREFRVSHSPNQVPGCAYAIWKL